MIELKRALFPDGEDHPPRLKDESAQAWTLNALAASYGLSGQSRRAVPLYEQQIAIREKQGVKRSVAIGLGNLALNQIRLGELAAAEGNHRRRIELCREVKEEFEEAVGHQELGRLLAYQGAFDEAARELDASYQYDEEHSDRQGQCRDWAYRALRDLLMGQPEAALEAARRARELADVRSYEVDIIWAEWLLGAALVALSPWPPLPQAEAVGAEAGAALAEAEPHLTEALTRCHRINLVDLEPDILLAWARWHHAGANTDQAHQDAQEALAIADRCEYRLKQAEIHNFLARLAWERVDELRGMGDEEGAAQALAEAWEQAEIAKERAWCDGPPHCYKPVLEEAERLLGEMAEARG
jgi:tetratricopeptide (TPR) repeat protein